LSLEHVFRTGDPIWSEHALVGTVYVFYLQLSSKRQEHEDGNWRQTIMPLNGTTPEDFGSKHFDFVDLDGATLVDMSYDADMRYLWTGAI